MLRSRRPRHRHGAQVCAIISALLLLVSVSLLYTRLSLFSSHHNLRAKPAADSDALLFPDSHLVSDSDEDAESADDRIDERDTLEEDRTNAVANENNDTQDLEQEQEDRSKGSSSGYYFDHVSGVIRRSLRRRSIDEWDYDYAGFTVGPGIDDSEDRSKTAFGSDDIPVDEAIRRKMSEVLGIEDALLLKTGKRVSPLREGWGNWFDKKGDFLRRDRMFKSNLENLNPLNNPLLQDPDGVGVTGLTRGDKLVQKWLLNEFKRVPFMGKKPLSVSESSQVLDLREDGNGIKMQTSGNERELIRDEPEARSHSARIKGTERKTLDDNGRSSTAKIRKGEPELGGGSLKDSEKSYEHSASSRGLNKEIARVGTEQSGDWERDRGKAMSVGITGRTMDASSRMRGSKDESPGHIYADGSTWGFYPGISRGLSFSEFMNEFFRSRCSVRVFMVWNSPPWMYTVRHQRGLESLLSHHRDACVVVYSETIELNFFRGSFVKDGYKVAVAMPNLDELLKDTPTHVFASVWSEWRKTKYYATHYSELVRLAALYKYGGVYLDTDIIVLGSLSSIENAIGMEDQAGAGSLNGAVMAFRKQSPFILECLSEYYMTYDDKCLRCNGADLLTRVAKSFKSEKNTATNQQELTIHPPFVFFPISSQRITRYFTSPAMETEKAHQDALFKTILNKSLTVHFWNSITSALIPEPKSLVAKLLDRSCIRCFDVL